MFFLRRISVTSHVSRSTAYGLLNSAKSVAGVGGPYLGGVLIGLSAEANLVFFASLLLVGAAAAAFLRNTREDIVV